MVKQTLRNLFRPMLQWYCDLPILHADAENPLRRWLLLVPQFIQYHFRRKCVPSRWKPGYFSQNGQDQIIADALFPDLRGGCFVDVGAHDGVTASNTCYLERERQWRGLAVEPVPANYAKLAAARGCQAVHACIAPTDGETNILVVEGYADVLSGIPEHFARSHLRRIDREISEHGGRKSFTRVPCYRLSTLLDRFYIHEVDYLSIDCEGADLAVLRSIDFARVRIRALTVENPGFVGFRLLRSHGFQLVAVAGRDDVYVQRKCGPLGEVHRIRKLDGAA